MTNHIIIGLGGTGGRILRAFRKTVFMEHGNVEPCTRDPITKKLSPPIAKIAYIYADSNNDDIDGQRELWRVHGNSIALDETSLIRIRDANLMSIFDSARSKTGISPWIGDEKILSDMVANCEGTPGANQNRRFGRFLFAASAAKYTSAINNTVDSLRDGSEARVSFHICCTLAAGTGSGSIIDAIAQIRKRNFGTAADYPIFLYLLITEQYQAAAAGNFYANQYAALAELNALRLGHFRPFDVTAASPTQLKVESPFQSCLLISGINDMGDTAKREEQEQMIADLLYQKIVALEGKIPDRMMKAETSEDLYPSFPHEMNERGYFASTLGLKRWVVPETEIKEKLLFSFALQNAWQFQFNNLGKPGEGYRAEARAREFSELVAKDAQNERWFLTDDHLKLSTDFCITGGNPWPSIAEDWNTALEAEKADIMANNPKAPEQWIPLFTEFADNYFQHLFREVGVLNYYNGKRDAKGEYAKVIRERVEADLFERWRSGQDGMDDSLDIAKTLNEQLDEHKRGIKLDTQIAAQKGAIKTYEDEATKIRRVWEKIGPLAAAFGKRKKVFESYVENAKALYVSKTQATALAFAKELLAEVRTKLRDLQNRLMECKKSIAEATSQIASDNTARCHPDEKVNYKSKIVKLIDHQAVEETIIHLTKKVDRPTQLSRTQKARDAACKELGLHQSFASFADKLNTAALKDLLMAVSNDTSIEAHGNLFAEPPAGLKRIVGVNIIERLYAEYQGVTEKLNNIIKELVSSAAPYVTIDRGATQPREILEAGDEEIPTMPKASWTIFLPICPALEEKFRAPLKAAFQAAGKADCKIYVEDCDHNPNEITIINFEYWCALRFLKPLNELRKKYEAKVTASEIAVIHQIHVENHRCDIEGLPYSKGIRALPGLFLPDISRKGFAFLIIAEALELLRLKTNPETRVTSLYLAERDSEDIPISPLLDLRSENILDGSSKLHWRSFPMLRQTVRTVLEKRFPAPKQPVEIVTKLDNLKKQKYLDFGRDDFNKDFKKWAQGIDDAKASLPSLLTSAY